MPSAIQVSSVRRRQPETYLVFSECPEQTDRAFHLRCHFSGSAGSSPTIPSQASWHWSNRTKGIKQIQHFQDPGTRGNKDCEAVQLVFAETVEDVLTSSAMFPFKCCNDAFILLTDLPIFHLPRGGPEAQMAISQVPPPGADMLQARASRCVGCGYLSLRCSLVTRTLLLHIVPFQDWATLSRLTCEG